MIWITLEDSMTQTASCYLHATRFTSCYTHTFAQGIYAIRILLTLDFSSHGSNAWAYCIYGIPFHFTTYHFCSVYLSDARARSMHMLESELNQSLVNCVSIYVVLISHPTTSILE